MIPGLVPKSPSKAVAFSHRTSSVNTAFRSNHHWRIAPPISIPTTTLATFRSSFNPVPGELPAHPSCSQLLSTAFLNPDGKVSVVVMNSSEKNIAYLLWVNGNAAEVNSLPHSIQTLVV